MSEWGLTDDELAKAQTDGLDEWLGLPVLERNVKDRGEYEARAVEKAAQKKLWLWLYDACSEHNGGYEPWEQEMRCDCEECIAKVEATLGAK